MHTNLSPFDLGYLDSGSPLRQYQLPSWPDREDDILPPVRVNGNFECAIPTGKHGVFSLSIPDQFDDSSPIAIPCSQVYADHLDHPKRRCSPFGFRYCLTFRGQKSTPGWTFIPYLDPPVPQKQVLSRSGFPYCGIIPNHTYKVGGQRRVLLDQYSHRIVVSNFRTFFCANLIPSYP